MVSNPVPCHLSMPMASFAWLSVLVFLVMEAGQPKLMLR